MVWLKRSLLMIKAKKVKHNMKGEPVTDKIFGSLVLTSQMQAVRLDRWFLTVPYNVYSKPIVERK